MPKKLIPFVLALCLIFSIGAMAENEGAANNNSTPQTTREMPTQAGQPGTPPEMPSGEKPQGGNRGGQMPQEEFTLPQDNDTNNTQATPQNGNSQDVNTTPENPATQNADNANGETGQQIGEFPGGMQGGFPGEMQSIPQNAETQQSTGFIEFVKTYSTPITSVILLMLAFVFVSFYKRRNY